MVIRLMDAAAESLFAGAGPAQHPERYRLVQGVSTVERRFPKAAGLLCEAREEMLAFVGVPKEHRKRFGATRAQASVLERPDDAQQMMEQDVIGQEASEPREQRTPSPCSQLSAMS
jgi:hypothetical protein